jgi:tripartite-type tricarboxylate transporter receptor subunit TctC
MAHNGHVIREMNMFGRIVLTAIALLSSATLAPAQSVWPDRPIKFVVHVAAGGGFDLMARILANRVSQQLPQSIVVENNGSGAGIVAARMVAHAEPDGYTFLFVGPGFASVPFLHKQKPYDPLKDFVPVSLVTRFPQLLVIRPDLPAKNLREFIALAKSEPGKLTFGSSGVGQASHLPAELFMHLAGVKMIHVPFRGGGPASAALLGGQIDMLFDGIAPQQGNIASGRVRALGVTTKERSPLLPDIPAIAEIVPGFQFPLWTGLFAPAGTPKPIVERLAAEIGKAMQDPATRKRYNDVKLEAIGSTPAEFDAFFREQLKFNEDVIKRANLQQD